MKDNNIAIIMAGGVGSRLWPISTKQNPKQFCDIMNIGKSLLQATFDRMQKMFLKENIYIISNKNYKNQILSQLKIDDKNIILEPKAKNTAAAIAYAVYKISAFNENANFCILPSDHLINDEISFEKSIKISMDYSQKNDSLVTIGIKSRTPNTGYGYIKFDKTSLNKLKKVIQFTEKPNLEKAKKFVSSGEYLWNSGIFIWNGKTIINSFEKLSPDIHRQFNSIEKSYNTDNENIAIKNVYEECESISIDYAILEKSDNVFVLPSDLGWDDLGTWKSIHNNCEKDENNNNKNQNITYHKSSNNYIRTDKKEVVIIGVNDLIVVEDNGKLLITHRDLEQEVKLINK